MPLHTLALQTWLVKLKTGQGGESSHMQLDSLVYIDWMIELLWLVIWY